MPKFNRRQTVMGGAAICASLAVPTLGRALPSQRSAKLRSFKPGAEWLDTAGKPIQAHGGSIIKVGDLFYWYGENKEHTTGLDGVWHWGVRCYSSADLYNWDDLGLIIPPRPEDPASPLNPKSLMDRPHILYNAATGKFVCWLKIMDERANFQTRTVLIADKVTGPYTIVKTGLRPLGMSAGDFDLVVSPTDAKAYMYFDRVHTEVICADLTSDYTDFTGYYSTHIPRPGAPTSREGPAYFRRGAKHYLATSGVTGYFPNPTEIAVADTFHGPFTTLGLLHPADQSHTSFNSQICSVFKHPSKKDLYIALADRWTQAIPPATFQTATDAYNTLRTAGKLSLTRDQITAIMATDMHRLNTSLARYVWLPIVFDGDRPKIEWRDEWSLDDFA